VALRLVTAPANDPVTLTEAKAHLDVEHSDHDTLIAALVDAAVSMVDGPKGFTGRAIISQTWDYYLDAFPDCNAEAIELPLPPCISVTGVYYTDAAGVEQTWDAASYHADLYSEPARILPAAGGSWPTPDDERPNAVRIRFTAGYVTNDSPPTDNQPAAIKAAILLIVGDLYRSRETAVIGQTVSKLPWTAEMVLQPYRFHKGFA
jgi:uncharacterized phiE125 gp8 family phage protein